MTETKNLLERVGERFAFPEAAFERLEHRRDRKRRNQRITAGVVGIAVFVATVWLVAIGAPADRTQTPAVPGGTGTGPTETGTTETGGAPNANLLTDYLLDLKTGETTPLPKGFPVAATMSPNGPWPSAQDPGRNSDWGQNLYALSPDGSEVAYYVDADWSPGGLFVARIGGAHVRQIADNVIEPVFSDNGPAWSPDGTKIAYTAFSGSGDNPDFETRWDDLHTNVFVVDLASGVTTQVTFETVPVSGTEFTPDGSSIVYTANLPGGSEVRIAPATGGEGSTLLGGHGTSASGASFSPDGSLLSYICADPPVDPKAPTQTRDLCLANADGSNPRVIARPETIRGPNGVGGTIVTASWSPDGSRLAYWTWFGVEGVYVLDLATGQTTRVVGTTFVEGGVTGNWPGGAWPGWLDNHTLIVEAYHGGH